MKFLGIDKSDVFYKTMLQLIKYTKQISSLNIHFAFACNNKLKIHPYQPINVLEYNNKYYFVNIRNNWICRECQHNTEGLIVMPMAETDSMFLDNYYQYSMPAVLRKIPCPKCGKQLQNHLCIIK